MHCTDVQNEKLIFLDIHLLYMCVCVCTYVYIYIFNDENYIDSIHGRYKGKSDTSVTDRALDTRER